MPWRVGPDFQWNVIARDDLGRLADLMPGVQRKTRHDETFSANSARLALVSSYTCHSAISRTSMFAVHKPIELVPQEIRVFLNLFGNGFYAAHKRARATADAAFQPLLTVATAILARWSRSASPTTAPASRTRLRTSCFSSSSPRSPPARASGWACLSATTL